MVCLVEGRCGQKKEKKLKVGGLLVIGMIWHGCTVGAPLRRSRRDRAILDF
jgi:hypothetical protein